MIHDDYSICYHILLLWILNTTWVYLRVYKCTYALPNCLFYYLRNLLVDINRWFFLITSEKHLEISIARLHAVFKKASQWREKIYIIVLTSNSVYKPFFPFFKILVDIDFDIIVEWKTKATSDRRQTMYCTHILVYTFPCKNSFRKPKVKLNFELN